ncbi:hypothetical protein [Flavobacterium sp. 102]|uniref:hypothetical protein n=1 Tax=Flavobacterium sp. 102 TaxID=2135623 RepID=UPI000EB597AA|nr:hypothetical protein [Flavobacterium sp. 102]RKS03197.1 hypothetical protein C8C84_2940 [Flavobacterium sp. 102]
MKEESSINTIAGIKSLVNQLPNISYGNNAIPYLAIEGFGNGQAGYDLLKSEFEKIDLSAEFLDLEKQIKKQKKEIKDLENKHTNLNAIIGEQTSGSEGSIASQILLSLKAEIEKLIEKRDLLASEISSKETIEETRILKQKEKEALEEENLKKKIEKLEQTYQEKEKALSSKFEKELEEINLKTKTANQDSNKKITDAEKNAIGKVKLINQFRDFLEETNKNMNLYSLVIIGILIAAIAAIGFSIPNLLNIFDSYDAFIKSQGTKITNWQIINYAFGLLIVKLPWALCLSAVLTGMYSLLKGLLSTYEKINQDKRNMSAIYAISGNVAQALNEYGINLAQDEIEDEETGEVFTSIRVSRKELIQKKESIRWNQIMKYFEGMQQNKVEIENDEDPTKVKLMSGILNKLIDKIPKT